MASFKRPLEPKLVTSVLPPEGQKWGSLNKFDAYSRWVIPEIDFDDLINALPMGASLRGVPGNGSTIATLPSTATWMSAQILNAGVYLFFLCADNNVYQVSLGGTVTKINGATAIGQNAQIGNWQGTTILITDPAAQRVYSWNGTTFSTVTALNGTPASYIAVYSGRLWGINNSTLWWTDVNNYASLGGSAGNVVITDEDCTTPAIGLMAFAGSLYLFGPGWMQVISNPQTSGSPAQLTFNKQTLQAEVGIYTQWAIQPYGPYLYFANAYGVWRLEGAFPVLVSEPLGGFFQNLAAGSTLSTAFCQIYGTPVLLWHGKWGGDSNYTIFGLTEELKWFRVNAGNVTFIDSIVSAAITNNLPTAWATDGTNVWQLFGNASAQVTSTYNTRYFNGGNPVGYKVVGKVGIAGVISGSTTVAVTFRNELGQSMGSSTQTYTPAGISFVNQYGQTLQFQNNSSQNLNALGSGTSQYQIWPFDVPDRCRALGLDINITSAGATLQNIALEYQESPAAWGS